MASTTFLQNPRRVFPTFSPLWWASVSPHCGQRHKRPFILWPHFGQVMRSVSFMIWVSARCLKYEEAEVLHLLYWWIPADTHPTWSILSPHPRRPREAGKSLLSGYAGRWAVFPFIWKPPAGKFEGKLLNCPGRPGGGKVIATS